jgi:hypothetical protein
MKKSMIINSFFYAIGLILFSNALQARVQFQEPISLPADTIPLPAITTQARLNEAQYLLDESLQATDEEDATMYKNDAIRIFEEILADPEQSSLQEIIDAKTTLATALARGKISDTDTSTDQYTRYYNRYIDDIRRAQLLLEEILESYKNHPDLDSANISTTRTTLAKLYLSDIPELSNFQKARTLFTEVVDNQKTLNAPLLTYIQAKMYLAHMLIAGRGGKQKATQGSKYLNDVIDDCKDSTDVTLRQVTNQARLTIAERRQADSDKSAVANQTSIRKYYNDIVNDAGLNPEYVLPETLVDTQSRLQQLEAILAAHPSPAKKSRLN